MTTLEITLGPRRQVFTEEDFPLSIGGSGAQVRLPGITDERPAAYLGLDHGRLFIQPARGAVKAAAITRNGLALTASTWLEAGDLVTVESVRLALDQDDGRTHLRVFCPVTPPAAGDSADGDLDFLCAPETAPVSPTPFTPRWQSPPPTRVPRLRPLRMLPLALLVPLIATAWYLFTARAVTVTTDPPAESLVVSGGVAPGWSGRYLLRPGSYRVRAERSGHLPVDATFEVGSGSPAELRFAFSPLGGLVSIRSRPVSAASVALDGSAIGSTPLVDFEVGAGTHTLEVVAPLHRPFTTAFTVAPGSTPLELDVDLEPNWARLEVSSSPPAAEVWVDGARFGVTPLDSRVEAGTRRLELRLPGFKTVRRALEVAAGRDLALGVLSLEPEGGRLSVLSKPSGATVAIASEYRGTTPLEVAVPPGIPLDLRVTLAGHEAFATRVEVAAGRRAEVRATLTMLTGEVVISSQPVGAELLIDGIPRGMTGRRLELPARPHDIEVRLEGFVSYRTSITPEPGLTRAVRADLRPAGPAGLPQTATGPLGTTMVLVGPGTLTMGAPRREPGRRANEVLREVTITRPFYLAEREVSNREFRQFQTAHLSGSWGGLSLEYDHHPVVNVSWSDAARYCNWLSEKAGLPPVYIESGGKLIPRSPLTVGFRLPTEAEWAWAARYAGSQTPIKYPWGNALPIPHGAGNFGDLSARDALRASLPDYNDGYSATAPVGSFAANPLGIFNLGDNVAEWVHDLYSFAPATPGTIEQDPVGPNTGTQHVIRGAGWMDTTVTELRLTHRDQGEGPRPDVGFRIARNAE